MANAPPSIAMQSETDSELCYTWDIRKRCCSAE